MVSNPPLRKHQKHETITPMRKLERDPAWVTLLYPAKKYKNIINELQLQPEQQTLRINSSFIICMQYSSRKKKPFTHFYAKPLFVNDIITLLPLLWRLLLTIRIRRFVTAAVLLSEGIVGSIDDLFDSSFVSIVLICSRTDGTDCQYWPRTGTSFEIFPVEFKIII